MQLITDRHFHVVWNVLATNNYFVFLVQGSDNSKTLLSEASTVLLNSLVGIPLWKCPSPHSLPLEWE